MGSRTNNIIISIAFMFAAIHCNGEALMGAILSAKRVNIPVYAGTEPVALLSIDQVFQEYPRKGFLRIGVAPRPVIQGITITILESSNPTNAFLKVCNHLRGFSALEYCQLRNVTMVHGKTRLQFSGLDISSAEEWSIKGQVSFESDGHVVSSRGGSLLVVGPEVGRFCTVTARGPVSMNFLQNPGHNQTTNEIQNSFHPPITSAGQ